LEGGGGGSRQLLGDGDPEKIKWWLIRYGELYFNLDTGFGMMRGTWQLDRSRFKPHTVGELTQEGAERENCASAGIIPVR